MRDWKQILAEADEEYLIGLSNKGVVKRAHKDMETVQAAVGNVDDEAEVTVGEETVTIRYPIGESGCSCPSRSICRHVIQALFVLRQEISRQGGTQEDMQTRNGPEQEPQCAEGQTPGQEIQRAEEKSQSAPEPETQPANEKLWQEIRDFPMQKAKRAMGSRLFRQFSGQIQADIRPEIQETTIITVTLPGQEHTVKLLLPLAYSSCTCHKKDLCAHKAAAILWCQYKAGVFTAESLEKEAAKQPELDQAAVREAAGMMKRCLETVLDNGLARAAADVLQDMERMAIIGHNAGLAQFENDFRALQGMCDKYFKRSAAFRIRDFRRQLTEIYRKACRALKTERAEEMAAFAGSFRAEYNMVGTLKLTGITMEQFESGSGYAGETVYFLEETEGKWYTYTNARPVFYDNSKRNRAGGWSRVPWELSGTLAEMAGSRIVLEGAKADGHRRLSSSGDTRGERMGARVLWAELLADWYYEDFFRLFLERIPERAKPADPDDGGKSEPDSGQELFFIRPSDLGPAVFSDTEQRLSLPLLDEDGREVIVEVDYSKRESETIRYLERFAEKWERNASKEEEDRGRPPCFLGKIYLREGRIRLYPLALLEEKELPADMAAVRGGKETYRRMDAGAIAAVREIVEEAAELMDEICQSGFDTIHDSTLKAMKEMKDTAEQYGLRGLSGLLGPFVKEIEMRRHRMGPGGDDAAGLYGDLTGYLYLCRQKILWDEAYEYYRGGNEL